MFVIRERIYAHPVYYTKSYKLTSRVLLFRAGFWRLFTVISHKLNHLFWNGSAFCTSPFAKQLPLHMQNKHQSVFPPLNTFSCIYLAGSWRKQATTTEDSEFHLSYFNHNWRNISTVYIYNKTSIKRNTGVLISP